MAKPSAERDPTWATGGGAVVTDPGVGKQATGWVADERPPAAHFNWWKNAVGQYLVHMDRLRRAEYLNWSVSGPGFRENMNDEAPDGIFYSATGSKQGEPVYVAATDATDASANAHLFWSVDGKSWQQHDLGATVAAAIKGGAHDVTGDVWCFGGGDDTFTGPATGGAFTKNTAAFGANFVCEQIILDDTNGLFIAVGTGSAGAIQTSTDGVTWIVRVNAATLGNDPISIAHDGAGNSVVVGTDICFTSADGVTWTDRSGFYPTLDGKRVVYSSQAAKWFAVGFGAVGVDVYETTDPDSVSWTTAYTVAGWNAVIGGSPIIEIDSDGVLLVAYHNIDNISLPYGQNDTRGVVSFDDGASWETFMLPRVQVDGANAYLAKGHMGWVLGGTLHDHSGSDGTKYGEIYQSLVVDF